MEWEEKRRDREIGKGRGKERSRGDIDLVVINFCKIFIFDNLE